MKRKLLALFMCAALAVSMLTACGGEKKESSEQSTKAEGETTNTGREPIAKDEIKVGVIHITDPSEGSGLPTHMIWALLRCRRISV